MRRKLGLPGLTVGWGPVANVGYVVEREVALVSAYFPFLSIEGFMALLSGQPSPSVCICTHLRPEQSSKQDIRAPTRCSPGNAHRE